MFSSLSNLAFFPVDRGSIPKPISECHWGQSELVFPTPTVYRKKQPKTKSAGHVPAFLHIKIRLCPHPFCPPSVWASRLRSTALAGRSARNAYLAANEPPAFRSRTGRGNCARCVVLPRGSLCGRRSRPGGTVLAAMNQGTAADGCGFCW